MLRRSVVYGLVAGLIVGLHLLGLGLVFKGGVPSPWGVLLGYLIMLIALSLVFIAIKRQRDLAGGGVIRFWPALGLGLGVSLVASLIYALAWEASLAISHDDFAAGYAKAVIARQQAKGVSGAALAKVVAQMERFKAQYANPLYRLPMTISEIFPVGALVSVISAALLRNSRFMPARR